jgi:hypothetical protein
MCVTVDLLQYKDLLEFHRAFHHALGAALCFTVDLLQSKELGEFHRANHYVHRASTVF